MVSFTELIQRRWATSNSLLCVGLDPDPERLPEPFSGDAGRLFAFNREIIDATAAFACAFKPQIAYYAAHRAEEQLEQTIRYIVENYPEIPVILDAKRGDIGATATMYAREAFERYGAHAVTVNPYMGGDTLEPFLDYPDRGVFVLCRTSNPGSGDFQAMESAGVSLAHRVAGRAAGEWNRHGNVGLVVGATWPEELGRIRALVGDLPLLVPGVGAQGGDLEQVLRNGATADGTGLLINVSRAIIYAGGREATFANAVADAAESFCRQVNAFRGQIH